MTASPITQQLLCAACSWPLPRETWTADQGDPAAPLTGLRKTSCPVCRTPLQIALFPALSHAKPIPLPERLAGEAEAACFYHAQNRAVKACDECGRFLCGLCELEVSGRTLCPVCFNAQASDRKLRQFDNRRTMHDTAALALATFPAVLFWPAIVTAPMAIFWVFRHWNSPRSILPRTRIRFYLAVLFALLEIAGIVLIIAAIVIASRARVNGAGPR